MKNNIIYPDIKRLIIGDIHGHWDAFKAIYDKELPDEVIILGDYFDNFHGTPESITECFDNILNLQAEHEDKYGQFILLLGNHDFHYIMDSEHYSGYNWRYANYASTKINECLSTGKIKIAYIDSINKTIYSHAGITNIWLNNSHIDKDNIEFINQVNHSNLCHKGNNIYGDDPINGPLWVRPDALLYDVFEDYEGYTWTQIVGHTSNKEPLIIKYDGTKCYGLKQNNEYRGHKVQGRDDLSIIYVMDCMPKYYMVELLDYNTNKLVERKIKQFNND